MVGDCDLWTMLQDDLRSLRDEVAEYRELGRRRAQAEAAYYAAKAKAALLMKAGGESATNIAMRVKGDGEVNRLLEEKIAAEALHDASREAINALKTSIRVNEGQLQREWSQDVRNR